MVGDDQGALPECAKSGGRENCAKAAFGDALCRASKWNAHRAKKGRDLASITGVRVSLVWAEKETGEQIIVKPRRSLCVRPSNCKNCAVECLGDRVVETPVWPDPNACSRHAFHEQRA